MPRIPTINPVSNGSGSSGIGLRTQRPFTVGSPEASQEVGAIPGRALQGLGQDAIQTSSILQNTVEIQAQTQRAQDVLDGKVKLYEYIPRLNTAYAEALEGPYQELPETVMARGNDLITEMSTGLRPNAAAIFKTEALERLSVLQLKAIGEKTQRRDAELLFTQSRAAEQARIDVENASNEAELAEATGRYEQLQRDMVAAGLVNGGVAAKNVAELNDTAQDTIFGRSIENNPAKWAEHLQLLLDNKPGLEGFPAVPPGKQGALHNLAQKELREQLGMEEAQRVAAERTVNEGQDRVERELTNQVMEARGVNNLLGLQRTVSQLALDETAGGLSGNAQRRLFSMINARIEDAKRPVEGKSNEALLTKYGVAVLTGRDNRSAEDTKMLMNQLAEATLKGQIRFKDSRGLLAELQEEQREDSPLRLPEVVRNRENLFKELQSTSPFDKFDNTAETRRSLATREYDDRVREIASKEGSGAAQQKSGEVYRELADNFAVNTIRSFQQQLNIPPRDLPAGIVDESAPPSSAQEISDRYGKGKKEIIRRYESNEFNKDEATRHLGTLNQRQSWWEYILQQNPPAQTKAKEPESFLRRAYNRILGGGSPSPSASSSTPAESAPSSGGFERNR